MVDKDRPPREWIAGLRRRSPCETEVDRMLSRKMTRRGNGLRLSPIPLTSLSRSLA